MKKRVMAAVLLIAYCAILIKVMVFKDIPPIRIGSLILNFAGTNAGHGPNFVPFKTIGPYLLGYNGWIIAGINLVGNIALLVPIGLLAPLLYRNMTWKKALALGVAAGLSIEGMTTVHDLEKGSGARRRGRSVHRGHANGAARGHLRH